MTSVSGVVDLEPLDVEGAVVEVVRRRVRVVAGAVVVAVGVADVEDQRARHEVEQDRSLLLGGAAGRADRDDVEDARPAGHRDVDAECAVGGARSRRRSSPSSASVFVAAT